MENTEWSQLTQPTKLFVAGVPSRADPRRVASFFKKFGPIKLGHSYPSSNSTNKTGKGFCHLLCFDQTLAEKLVEIRYYDFMGRTLTVTFHKSGNDLVVQSKQLNKYRVILKRVPGSYTEDLLKQELLSRGWNVQLLFEYRLSSVNLLDTVNTRSSR